MVLMDFQEKDICALFERQINKWPLAKQHYEGLKNVERKVFHVDGNEFVVQYNPSRIVSASAATDEKSIRKRPCFLCEKDLPPEQDVYLLNTRFLLLVNPYPIFIPHFTIPHREHIPQQLLPYCKDLLSFTRKLEGYTIFYNGPKSGASAPDHLHFQACKKGNMPVEKERKKLLSSVQCREKKYVYIRNSIRSLFLIETEEMEEAVSALNEILGILPVKGDMEPMVNLLATYEENKYIIYLFPRKLHRPSRYFHTGKDQLLISPGAVDMGGMLITPRKEDFEKITGEDIRDIFREISLFL